MSSPPHPSLLEDLNPQQQAAVKATDGPILILAGAGSGKTRVLTYKVAYLISEKKVPAENILCLTFTNKAAGEMKERILKLLHTNNQHLPTTLPTMGTFHSFCAKLLRVEGKNIGLSPGFAIYDENDALDAVKEAMKNVGLDVKKNSPTAIRATISSAKNELISALEYPQYARGYFQENVAKVYLEYQNILEKNSAVDFDDLLLLTIKLFQNFPEILSRYQTQFRYILIDEYQDTNPAQYLISQYLAKQHRNICVVGDASQSIYAFRGADFRNIVNFQKDYPQAKVFNLEQNYRSTQIILDAAHGVISKNRSHPILSLWTDKAGGEKIDVYEAKNEVDEANFIISKLIPPLSRFAILYRTNAQSRVLEEQLLKAGVPYQLFGGVSFYQRKEIKDVLSYLRLMQNPKDSVALKRAEKIGKGRLVKVMEVYEQVSSQLDKYSSRELLDMILNKSGYLSYIDDNTEVGKARVENVKELLSVAEQFPHLTDFLENVALVESSYMPNGKPKTDNHKSTEVVTLMTLHSAKGLEYPVVFMVGIEEGLFPHSRSMLDPNQLEEERRLCYVGITRAMDKLYLTYARQRLYFGQRSNNLVSRFLADIPESLIAKTSNFVDLGTDFDPDTDGLNVDVSPVDEDDWLNF